MGKQLFDPLLKFYVCSLEKNEQPLNFYCSSILMEKDRNQPKHITYKL